MTTEEALAHIAETNEPLAVVLQDLLQRTRKLEKGQQEALQSLIAHIISNGSTIDLTAIVSILKQQGGN